jgi:hypothetical protein
MRMECTAEHYAAFAPARKPLTKSKTHEIAVLIV